MHEYDYIYWSTIDKLAWGQLKYCAKVMIRTLIGLAITLAAQPVRLYEYARWKWDNREEAVIEREETERFKNLMETGHI